MKVLVPAMMSSEESADEENVNYVKDLPWRASIVKEIWTSSSSHRGNKICSSHASDKKSYSKFFRPLPTSPTGNANVGSERS